MHRILLRTICIDVTPESHDAGLAFWPAALAAEPRRGIHFPEYHVLEHPAAVTTVYLQRIEVGDNHFHLDIEADDVAAEVARLVSLGARIVEQHHDTPVGDWTVLRDPAGLLFCVVAAEVNDDFDARAISVGE